MLGKLSIKKAGLLPLLLAGIMYALPALALDLGQAKSGGMVKETASGYLAVVKSSGEVNALVNKINAGRKAEYQKIAKKRGTSLGAVEKLMGEKLAK